jgi:hypothetical protein
LSAPDQRFADAPLFLRTLGENAGHRPRLHKLFLKGLAVAAGQRWVMMTPLQIAEAQKLPREWKPTPQPTPQRMNRVKTLPTNVRYRG